MPRPRVFLSVLLTCALAAWPTPAQAAYTLDHGDTLTVAVRDTPKWGGTYAVRPDGQLVIPFLLELDVRGLTVEEVRNQVLAAVSRELHEPDVSVVVASYRPRVVTVLGEVATPGNIVLQRADQTLLDTIAAAGGFTDRALPDQVTILRGTGRATRRIPVNVAAMMATGDMAADLRLEPGDRVQVARNPWPSWREAFATTQQVVSYLGTISLLLMLARQLSPPQ
ncbi:MAG: polysaccharide biosynthesis/export family protein [Candidatus Sericytochromatia bacterium]|nr:polysaccharide biosynthesis/export family protein [Candidatus Sericytochromatia bacterium]